MSLGDPWLYCDRIWLEVEGSTPDLLMLKCIKPPWLGDLKEVPRVLCTPLLARYQGGRHAESQSDGTGQAQSGGDEPHRS